MDVGLAVAVPKRFDLAGLALFCPGSLATLPPRLRAHRPKKQDVPGLDLRALRLRAQAVPPGAEAGLSLFLDTLSSLLVRGCARRGIHQRTVTVTGAEITRSTLTRICASPRASAFHVCTNPEQDAMQWTPAVALSIWTVRR